MPTRHPQTSLDKNHNKNLKFKAFPLFRYRQNQTSSDKIRHHNYVHKRVHIRKFSIIS